jgi:hypothetical protein
MTVTGRPGDGDGEGADPDVSVVIPTLNEEEAIADCIGRVRRGLEDTGVTGEVVVSDSSSDRTATIARDLGARVVEPDQRGYGTAYRHGFEHARGDVIVMGDGDTTYDFGEIPRLIAQIEDGADLVVGDRFDGGIEPGAMPWLHRYVGNPFLTAFLNVFYRTDVSDAHSGFRAFRREVLGEIEPTTTGMEFATEMLVRAREADLDVREVPVTYHKRVGEPTLNSFSDGWRHLRFMIAHTPGEVFALPGLAMVALGVALMTVTFFDLPPLGMLSTNSMIAGALLTLLGSNVFALGVISAIAGDPIRNPRRLVSADITAHVSIERGLVVGLVLFAVGGVAAFLLIVRWLATGFEAVPAPTVGVLAMTALAFGLQTIFQMLFISVLIEDGES